MDNQWFPMKPLGKKLVVTCLLLWLLCGLGGVFLRASNYFYVLLYFVLLASPTLGVIFTILEKKELDREKRAKERSKPERSA